MKTILPILVGVLFLNFVHAVSSQEASSFDLNRFTEAIQSSCNLDREQALVELTNCPAAPKEAAGTICKLLDSDSYVIRGLAVDALVKIGEPAVKTIRESLRSKSAQERAAAIQALIRLKAIKSQEISTSKSDADVRVRAASAMSLQVADSNVFTDLLIQFLSDVEPAVAVQACHSARMNAAKSKASVSAFATALKRPATMELAANNLSDLGTDAQAAIPQLLESLGTRTIRLYTDEDAIDEALQRIGPPSLEDLEKVCRLLDHENVERTIEAADAISRLGIAGKSAGDELERAIQQIVKNVSDLKSRGSSDDIPGRTVVAAEHCAAAYWNVTRDAKRFVELVEAIAESCESGVSFSSPSPWKRFVGSDVEQIGRLFDSNNAYVLESGYVAVCRIGPAANQYVDRIVTLLDANMKTQWTNPESALGAMGHSVADKSLPAIVGSFRKGRLALNHFAHAIEEVGVRSEESAAILVEGLSDRNEWTPAACARALCKTSTDPEKTATIVLKAYDNRRCSARQTIVAFRLLDDTPDRVREFFVEHLTSGDVWTRCEAATALGEMGVGATALVEKIQPLLRSEHIEERVRAAKALYLITNDAPSFDQLLKTEFSSKDTSAWSKFECVSAIGSLAADGKKFQHHLIANQAPFQEHHAEGFCNALRDIGSEEAVRCLEQLSKSKNWKSKSAAIAALDFIKNLERKSIK